MSHRTKHHTHQQSTPSTPPSRIHHLIWIRPTPQRRSCIPPYFFEDLYRVDFFADTASSTRRSSTVFTKVRELTSMMDSMRRFQAGDRLPHGFASAHEHFTRLHGARRPLTSFIPSSSALRLRIYNEVIRLHLDLDLFLRYQITDSSAPTAVQRPRGKAYRHSETKACSCDQPYVVILEALYSLYVVC
jgi:hypothetical protein